MTAYQLRNYHMWCLLMTCKIRKLQSNLAQKLINIVIGTLQCALTVSLFMLKGP